MQDFKHPVNQHIFNEVQDQFCEEPHLVSPEFKQLAESILSSNNLNPPSNFLEALEVYFTLIVTLDDLL